MFKPLVGMVCLCVPLSVAHAESAQAVIQRVVASERAANLSDRSNWMYLDELTKPKEHTVQIVIATQHGAVRRTLRKNDQRIPDAKQREEVQSFLEDMHAQKKALSEDQHDAQQVDDLLKLLPVAFLWTQMNADATNTTLHFEPDPNFHPPTREARVFSNMVGEVVVDNQQNRIRSMSGRLTHEVTFGGGLLGKLKEGSRFALEQSQVGPSLWQLTALHVDLEGNALLFKSVSLQQDDRRTRFQPQPAEMTLEQAAAAILKQPD